MKRTPIVAILLTLGATVLLLLPGCDELITENNETTLFDTTLGLECIQCHTDANDALIQVPKGQWANSAHASFRLLEATVDLNGGLLNTAECGPVCHSGNGYVDFIENASTGAQSQPSIINCFTCHMPHSGDFGSFQLATLRGDDTTGISLVSNRRYSGGKSNMCANCHQLNRMPVLSPSVTLTADFGPHFSPQADVLIGSGGIWIDSGDVVNTHRTALLKDGCNSCHFGDGIGYSFGEHTFRLEDESTGQEFLANCEVSGCHVNENLTSLHDFPMIAVIDSLADSLETLLRSLSILDSSDTSGIRFNSGMSVSSTAAGMLHNYLLYRLDGSGGVHNTRFDSSLLVASLARYDSLPQPLFTAGSSTAICLGLPVDFVDQSTNATSWTWDFGDGNGGMSNGDTSYTYSASGSYTVTLTIDGDGGQASFTRVDFVTVADSVTAGFSADTSVTPGDSLTIVFTDTSAGVPIGWTWQFGDGNFDISNNPSPSHTYATPGTYEVILSAGNACNIDIFMDSIVVPLVSMPASSSRGGPSRFRR